MQRRGLVLGARLALWTAVLVWPLVQLMARHRLTRRFVGWFEQAILRMIWHAHMRRTGVIVSDSFSVPDEPHQADVPRPFVASELPFAAVITAIPTRRVQAMYLGRFVALPLGVIHRAARSNIALEEFSEKLSTDATFRSAVMTDIARAAGSANAENNDAIAIIQHEYDHHAVMRGTSLWALLMAIPLIIRLCHMALSSRPVTSGEIAKDRIERIARVMVDLKVIAIYYMSVIDTSVLLEAVHHRDSDPDRIQSLYQVENLGFYIAQLQTSRDGLKERWGSNADAALLSCVRAALNLPLYESQLLGHESPLQIVEFHRRSEHPTMLDRALTACAAACGAPPGCEVDELAGYLRSHLSQSAVSAGEAPYALRVLADQYIPADLFALLSSETEREFLRSTGLAVIARLGAATSPALGEVADVYERPGFRTHDLRGGTQALDPEARATFGAIEADALELAFRPYAGLSGPAWSRTLCRSVGLHALALSILAPQIRPSTSGTSSLTNLFPSVQFHRDFIRDWVPPVGRRWSTIRPVIEQIDEEALRQASPDRMPQLSYLAILEQLTDIAEREARQLAPNDKRALHCFGDSLYAHVFG